MTEQTKKTEEVKKVKKTEEVKKRIPLHKARRNILDAPEREGFKRRWVNEKIGAVEAHEQAGWKVVIERDLYPEKTKKIQEASQQGTVVRRVVNPNVDQASARTAVLMEIPLEFFNEDKREAQKRIDELEASYDPQTLAEHNPNFFGSMQTKRSNKLVG